MITAFSAAFLQTIIERTDLTLKFFNVFKIVLFFVGLVCGFNLNEINNKNKKKKNQCFQNPCFALVRSVVEYT